MWCCCHAVNIFQILILDTPYITKEGEIWHVFCDFKVWFKFCCYHCYLGCLYGLVALFIKVLFNPIVIKSVWVKKLSASPKCLTRDFTNLNRIYKALQTKVWWAMEVFHLCWLKSCSSAFTLVTICMIICSLAHGRINIMCSLCAAAVYVIHGAIHSDLSECIIQYSHDKQQFYNAQSGFQSTHNGETNRRPWSPVFSVLFHASVLLNTWYMYVRF